MPQLALEDVIRHALHRLGDIGKEPAFLTVIKQIEQRTRLAVIVITFAMVVAAYVAEKCSTVVQQNRYFHRYSISSARSRFTKESAQNEKCL
jgi:hypothetical protein